MGDIHVDSVNISKVKKLDIVENLLLEEFKHALERNGCSEAEVMRRIGNFEYVLTHPELVDRDPGHYVFTMDGYFDLIYGMH